VLAFAANMLVPLCMVFSPVRRLKDVADGLPQRALAAEGA
jgi:hypothetical protein